MMNKFALVLGFWMCGAGVAMMHAQAQHDADARPLPCVTDGLLKQLHADYPSGVPGRNLPETAKTDGVAADFTYYIPVVVHVMHAFGPEMNVTGMQIESQIAVMNEGFGRYGSGFNDNPLGGKSNVQFCLASIDPDGKPTLGYEYIPTLYAANLNPFTQDTLLKRISQWDPKRYLNIWTVRQIVSGFEGYAYVPSEAAGTVYDGIVMDYESFGAFPFGTARTLGQTGTHEAGHFLGLYHPWGLEEGVCADGGTDFCDDTPPVPEIYFSRWPACDQPVACDGDLRQVANFMDYADDACQNLFTQCQVDRVLHNTLTYRSEMVSSKNLARTGCASATDSTPALDSIFVYPVPATTYLTINMDLVDVGSAKVEMTDMTGRKVYAVDNIASGRGPFSIEVSQFPQGIYMLHVWTSKAEVHRRVRLGY